MSIALCCLLAFPGVYNFSLFLNYQIEMEAYVEDCTNKDIPMMHCDGKCVLAQKLIKAKEENRPDSPTFVTDVSEYIASLEQLMDWELPRKSLDFVFAEGIPTAYTSALFHPPCLD